MAAEMWVTVESKYCDLIEADVQLEERWVFPDDIIPDLERYRVLGRRCSADVACNIAGIPCRWAYTNPVVDQFHEAA